MFSIDCLDTMQYILESHVHIRGCWCVKFKRRTNRKDLERPNVAAAPTYSKCANEHVKSKTFTKALENAGVYVYTVPKDNMLVQNIYNVLQHKKDKLEESNHAVETTSIIYKASERFNRYGRHTSR